MLREKWHIRKIIHAQNKTSFSFFFKDIFCIFILLILFRKHSLLSSLFSICVYAFFFFNNNSFKAFVHNRSRQFFLLHLTTKKNLTSSLMLLLLMLTKLVRDKKNFKLMLRKLLSKNLRIFYEKDLIPLLGGCLMFVIFWDFRDKINFLFFI